MRIILQLAGPVFTAFLIIAPCGRCSEALDTARAAEDWPAVAEISRRELDKSPQDAALWQACIGALLKMDGRERAVRELDEWEKTAKPRPAAIDELRGDMAEKPDDALKFWKAFVKAEPSAVETLDKIVAKELELARWADAERTLTQRIEAEAVAPAYAERALARLGLARYDDAFADIRRANETDATDAKVKEWLPRFESLEKNLKRLRGLDKKIAASPADPVPLLERAQLFSDMNCVAIALADAERAHGIAPGSRRALLQYAGALKRAKGESEAARLPRVFVKPLPADAAGLNFLGVFDAKVAARPDNIQALTARAAELNTCGQFGLALDDAEAALKINADNVAALVEAGHALIHLEKHGDAAQRLERATQLDPANAYAWLWRAELANLRADHAAAVDFATRSLALRETPAALRFREQALRAIGRNAEADRDALKLSGTKK